MVPTLGSCDPRGKGQSDLDPRDRRQDGIRLTRPVAQVPSCAMVHASLLPAAPKGDIETAQPCKRFGTVVPV